MKILAEVAPIALIQADWLVVGVFEDMPGPNGIEVASLPDRLLTRLLESGDFKAKPGETCPLVSVEPGRPSVLLLGLGKVKTDWPKQSFASGFAAAKRLAALPRGSVAVVSPIQNDPDPLRSLVEGVLAGTSGPGLRKAEASRHRFASLTVVAPPGGPFAAEREALGSLVKRAEVGAEAVTWARELANTPPREKAPRQLAGRIADELAPLGVSVEVWDEERIARERFGGLLGVAAGSAEPPRFVVLEWRGGLDPSAPATAFVGKGVTFDSGGLSLKPSASMEDMKADMTGAAVVASAFRAVARLGLPVALRGYLPLTENMTGGAALKLGDVLTMRNGTTVEVLNTDAEGRLILADALAYAVEQKPARVLDLATLTGACVVALGTKVAGLFGSDADWNERVACAARCCGERTWQMPIDDDYGDLLKSQVADCKNVGSRWGGAITAAKFLQRFVAEVPWAHLDIAGPSWVESDSPGADAGATGCFARSLVRLAEDLVAAG